MSPWRKWIAYNIGWIRQTYGREEAKKIVRETLLLMKWHKRVAGEPQLRARLIIAERALKERNTAIALALSKTDFDMERDLDNIKRMAKIIVSQETIDI
jgi:hypothetical protein